MFVEFPDNSGNPTSFITVNTDHIVTIRKSPNNPTAWTRLHFEVIDDAGAWIDVGQDYATVKNQLPPSLTPVPA